MNSGAISALNTGPAEIMGLCLGSEICEALRAEAFEGLKALPRRGLEVGGVLTESTGAAAASTIDGFECIESQHLYGPSYRLSPLDHERLFARCRELQNGGAVRIAAFFRSSTRDAVEVTPEDTAIAGELSDSAAVVIIQPFPTGSATFHIFQPDPAKDGEWREAKSFEVGGSWIDSPPPAPASAAAPPKDEEIGTIAAAPSPIPALEQLRAEYAARAERPQSIATPAFYDALGDSCYRVGRVGASGGIFRNTRPLAGRNVNRAVRVANVRRRLSGSGAAGTPPQEITYE